MLRQLFDLPEDPVSPSMSYFPTLPWKISWVCLMFI